MFLLDITVVSESGQPPNIYHDFFWTQTFFVKKSFGYVRNLPEGLSDEVDTEIQIYSSWETIKVPLFLWKPTSWALKLDLLCTVAVFIIQFKSLNLYIYDVKWPAQSIVFCVLDVASFRNCIFSVGKAKDDSQVGEENQFKGGQGVGAELIKSFNSNLRIIRQGTSGADFKTTLEKHSVTPLKINIFGHQAHWQSPLVNRWALGEEGEAGLQHIAFFLKALKNITTKNTAKGTTDPSVSHRQWTMIEPGSYTIERILAKIDNPAKNDELLDVTKNTKVAKPGRLATIHWLISFPTENEELRNPWWGQKQKHKL